VTYHFIAGALKNPENVIAPINALDSSGLAGAAAGYGLTLGIQTRIDSRAQALAAAAHVGNIYINRNMIGAVVGVQPFGGEGLSGTGPKAGGPHYLYRFCAEQTVTVNTTAAGGNMLLMAKAPWHWHDAGLPPATAALAAATSARA
jgi:RHH-type transcriptional regulator, proline utilization regulon repressor / proline dehydrogenase / delta 1-pyrroline-5-carboxylate dehydrogenase